MRVTELKLMLIGMLIACLWMPVMSKPKPKRYQVAACDWMMLKRQKLGEFALAKQIGADGVELDMGSLGKRVLFENQLRDPEKAALFRRTADSLGVQVPSVAMSGFFAQNLITRENYLELVRDCFKSMKVFGTKVAFLPLGGSGQEWQAAGALHDEMVRRLRAIGELAVNEGVIVGLRTGEDAAYDKRLLKEIKSKGIKIYFNFQVAADAGRDICEELKRLGRKNIIQIHASNTDGKNLREDPEINMPAIKQTLDKMGWSGWLVIERSRDTRFVRDVKRNFGNNVAYLKEIFQ
ncbi:MAG: sugar phosphate isomerase/epimerase [Prevotella sp.]|nr:sugar phosphate isomerase/epimerase [Prevotella sp.]MDY4039804.1 sugar phosphate isomerase/epimerase family protein [Prevotella sp.]